MQRFSIRTIVLKIISIGIKSFFGGFPSRNFLHGTLRLCFLLVFTITSAIILQAQEDTTTTSVDPKLLE
ncbi:MAG: hypothetical protein ACSLE0_11790, partial [Chitinophagaceae bacterium]